MRKLFTAALIAFVSVATSRRTEEVKEKAAPEHGPVWPDQFEQNLVDEFTYPVLGKHTTKASFHYDYTNKRYRIDRENGHYDRYCGPTYPFSNTACNQIVVGGKRYLHYPDKNYCCYCCGAEHGCGILKPEWAKSAQFEGFEGENQEVQKWNAKGLQNNFIWFNESNGQITRIKQEPNEDQIFDQASFTQGIKDPSIFELPSICNPNKTCPLISTCTAVRWTSSSHKSALSFLEN